MKFRHGFTSTGHFVVWCSHRRLDCSRLSDRLASKWFCYRRESWTRYIGRVFWVSEQSISWRISQRRRCGLQEHRQTAGAMPLAADRVNCLCPALTEVDLLNCLRSATWLLTGAHTRLSSQWTHEEWRRWNWIKLFNELDVLRCNACAGALPKRMELHFVTADRTQELIDASSQFE